MEGGGDCPRELSRATPAKGDFDLSFLDFPARCSTCGAAAGRDSRHRVELRPQISRATGEIGRLAVSKGRATALKSHTLSSAGLPPGGASRILPGILDPRAGEGDLSRGADGVGTGAGDPLSGAGDPGAGAGRVVEERGGLVSGAGLVLCGAQGRSIAPEVPAAPPGSAGVSPAFKKKWAEGPARLGKGGGRQGGAAPARVVPSSPHLPRPAPRKAGPSAHSFECRRDASAPRGARV